MLWLVLIATVVFINTVWHILRAPRKELHRQNYTESQINRIRRNFPRNWIRPDERELHYGQTETDPWR